VVKKAWKIKGSASESMEIWQSKIRLLRRRIKGWSKNIEAKVKKTETASLLRLIYLIRRLRPRSCLPMRGM
jgi:hypothetical protein